MYDYASTLSELKKKLVGHIKFTANMVRGGIREFVYNMDGEAFLKREMARFGVDRCREVEFIIAHVDWCPFMHFVSISPVSPM